MVFVSGVALVLSVEPLVEGSNVKIISECVY